MLDIKQFREFVIQPVLQYLHEYIPHTTAAENLLIGTASHESGLVYLHQIGGGPARGLFQMEPETEMCIWNNFLKYRVELRSLIDGLCSARFRDNDLRANLPYQVAMARLQYWRSPLSLPAAEDVRGLARLWKIAYNTPLGRGTEEQFIRHYPR